MPQVSISFVDGSKTDFEEDAEFINKLTELQSRGLEGKTLIHSLIGDDWGPPPRYVTIVHGEFELTISYS